MLSSVTTVYNAYMIDVVVVYMDLNIQLGKSLANQTTAKLVAFMIN